MPLHSFVEEIARFIFEIVSCFSASIFFFLLRVMKNVATSDAPAMPHPIGPARARRAFPAAIPPAATPPPNQASAAFVAAAPDKAEIAVPVEAVPNVVATHIAAVGPIAAIAPPAPTPAAAPTAPFFAFSYSCFANSCAPANFSLLNLIASILVSNVLGWFAILFTKSSTFAIVFAALKRAP